MRLLRDREALVGSEEGFAEFPAGRLMPLGADLRSEMEQAPAPLGARGSVLRSL